MGAFQQPVPSLWLESILGGLAQSPGASSVPIGAGTQAIPNIALDRPRWLTPWEESGVAPLIAGLVPRRGFTVKEDPNVKWPVGATWRDKDRSILVSPEMAEGGVDPATLAHELTHLLQHYIARESHDFTRTGPGVQGYRSRSGEGYKAIVPILVEMRDLRGKDPYNYGGLRMLQVAYRSKVSVGDFGKEQQASMVEDWIRFVRWQQAGGKLDSLNRKHFALLSHFVQQLKTAAIEGNPIERG